MKTRNELYSSIIFKNLNGYQDGCKFEGAQGERFNPCMTFDMVTIDGFPISPSNKSSPVMNIVMIADSRLRREVAGVRRAPF